MDKYEKTIVYTSIVIAIIIMTYWVIIPFQRPLKEATVKASIRDGADVCEFAIAGGQFLWSHYGEYRDAAGRAFLGGSGSKLVLPASVTITARQGEVFTVTITYYKTIVDVVQTDGVEVQKTRYAEVGKENVDVTL